MQDYVIDLQKTVERATSLLVALGDDASAKRPAPGKWSAREIIGHLIDSASNNHQRFVRSQWQDDLMLQGYEQDAWVSAQQYQQAPWRDLVTLWASFNRHIARVMAAVPDAARTRLRPRHNLDDLAWEPVPASEPTTLDYLMRDYVGHLKHHLRQALGQDWDGSTQQ
jgi:hypothetical protein